MPPKATPAADAGGSSPTSPATGATKIVKKVVVVKRAASPSAAGSAPAPAPAAAAKAPAATPTAAAEAPKASPGKKVVVKKVVRSASPKSAASPPSSPKPDAAAAATGELDALDDLLASASAAPAASPSPPAASPAKKLMKKAVATVVAANKLGAAATGLLIAEAPAIPSVHQTNAKHESADHPEPLKGSVDPDGSEYTIRLAALHKTVEDFYRIVAPDKAGKVADVARQFLCDELRLFGQLETKYRYGATEKEKRRRAIATAGKPSIPPPPVYPYGYLQKEFHKNLATSAIQQACKDQLVANKLKEQRLILSRAKAAAAAAAAANPSAPAAPLPKQRPKDAIVKEVEAMVSQLPTNQQIEELVRLATTPLANAKTQTATATYSLSVFADVAVRCYEQAKVEGEWDRKVVSYLETRAEEAVAANASAEVGRTASALIARTESIAQPHSIGGGAVAPLADPTAPDATLVAMGLSKDAPQPTPSATDDARLWQLVHEHHQRIRRSLFIGEAIADEVLPTGEAKVKAAAAAAPPSVAATILHASIGAGYASTCDVTPRQQVQAFVMKYCPHNLPLVMPALWQYKGREHELIGKLHAEYGLDKAPKEPADKKGAAGASGGATPATPTSPNTGAAPPITADYVATAPNTINSYPDPLVGSEIYLSDVMHGAVCGLSREVEYDSRFKLIKEGMSEAAVAGAAANPNPTRNPLNAIPPCAYPCEDATFRSWSNVPVQLHPTAHMARHFGLGPQFVHQLHAQNPLNPSACGYELLCALFPDAVYFCLDDDEQRLAFMTRRVSELMSFVQTCDPSFTRPHKALPDGSGGSGSQLTLMDAIPRLFQKYSPLRDTLTDEQYEQQEELNRNAVNSGSKYTRKPSKNVKGIDMGNDDYNDEYGEGSYKNRPERALADVFAQHFGVQLRSAEQSAFPWEDLYKHINHERHQQVLNSCGRWSKAYGPAPPVSSIQLDIVGVAVAAAVEGAKGMATTGTSTNDGGADDVAAIAVSGVADTNNVTATAAVTTTNGLKQVPMDFPESSCTTPHIPTALADPHSPTLALVDTHNATTAIPSLLHRMACQQLTRSTPTVYDSILKPWLKNTKEVGTMTRHKEEEAMYKMLNSRSVGTCVAEDEVNVGDEKYQGWPMPFRYEEEYRQAVSKMSLPELRRERHRALFGSRADAGVVMFGNKGRPLPPNASRDGMNDTTLGNTSAATSGGYHRGAMSPSPTRGGGGGGGVRFAADGTIDLSSSSQSRSPLRHRHAHANSQYGMGSVSPPRRFNADGSEGPSRMMAKAYDTSKAGGGPNTTTATNNSRRILRSSSSPSRPRQHTTAAPQSSTVAHLYKFEKHYEQWFAENIGESGRGRFDYRKQIDPDRAARRRHRELYFGVPAGMVDPTDSDGDDLFGDAKNDDAALMDAVFGEGGGGNGTSSLLPPRPQGPAAKALQAAITHKSPYWFDHDPADYADADDDWLASRTSGDGVVGLVGRYRRGQVMLAAAQEEVDALREEVRALRGAVDGGTLLTVPRLALADTSAYNDVFDGPITGYSPKPKTFATAASPNGRGANAITNNNSCTHCEDLQAKVNVLLERLGKLRGNSAYQQQLAANAQRHADLINASNNAAYTPSLAATANASGGKAPPMDIDALLFGNDGSATAVPTGTKRALFAGSREGPANGRESIDRSPSRIPTAAAARGRSVIDEEDLLAML